MPKLPSISGRKLLRILEKYDFQIIRVKGSHVFIAHRISKKSTVVPVHANEDLGKGLLHSILSDLDIEGKTFLKMFRNR